MTAADIVKARTELLNTIMTVEFHEGLKPIENDLREWLAENAWRVIITGKRVEFKHDNLDKLVELYGRRAVSDWLPKLPGLDFGVLLTQPHAIVMSALA